MNSKNKMAFLKLFLLEMAIYITLVTVYFFTVLRYLTETILNYFENDLRVYAVLALALIVGQGIVFEFVTRTIIDNIGKRGVG